MTKERLLDRIRKLLRLATSPNEAEAMAALSKAHELLAEHNLTLSDVTDETDADEYTGAGLITDNEGWRGVIGASLAPLYFSVHVIDDNSLEGKIRHYFLGRKENAMVARMMFTYLLDAVEYRYEQAVEESPDFVAWTPEYRESFCMGAALKLALRLTDKLKEARSGTLPIERGSNLPAIYATEMDKIEEMLKGRVEPIKMGGGGVGPGTAQGIEAGDTIGLDTQINYEVGSSLAIGEGE